MHVLFLLSTLVLGESSYSTAFSYVLVLFTLVIPVHVLLRLVRPVHVQEENASIVESLDKTSAD